MTFTETLRAENQDLWERAISHRFVREIGEGSIPDAVMAQYLVQDYRFVDGFLAVIGCAIATTDTLEARLELARMAGEVASEENTYFLRSFDALGVTAEDRAGVPDAPATTGFVEMFRDAAGSGQYAAALTVLVVAEWLYLEWARTVSTHLPDSFVHAEWIALHDNAAFRDRVAFLRAELDRVGEEQLETARAYFARAMELEVAFFDDCYRTPLEGVER